MTSRSARLHSYGGCRQRGTLLLARLFPERQIVMRTGLRRCCFTVSTTLQAVVAAVAVGTALWQGLVTSEWLDSTAVIAHKNYQIVELRVDRNAAIHSMKSSESRFRGLAGRISGEIDDIQRDLALLARHDSLTSKPVAAYTLADSEPATEHARDPLRQTLDAKLSRLEEFLRSLKSRHSELSATSARTASAQLDRLESALARIGIDTRTLVARPPELGDDSATDFIVSGGEGEGRGGPFVSVEHAKAEHEPPIETLHDTLHRWNDLVVATSRLPLGAPVENLYMSSGFGRRRDPFNHRPAVHAGIDYAGLSYTPVLATGSGVVSYANRKGRYGTTVEIDHGHGFVTRYAHLAELSVTVGQRVERGTEIGLVGSTGRSTGPHLHYELRVGNEPRDPIKFIGVGKNVFKRHSQDGQG